MEKLLFITGYIGTILAFSDGTGFPFINFMGCLLVLASIMVHKFIKEK